MTSRKRQRPFLTPPVSALSILALPVPELPVPATALLVTPLVATSRPRRSVAAPPVVPSPALPPRVVPPPVVPPSRAATVSDEGARDHAGPTSPVLNEPGGNAANLKHGGGEWAARGVSVNTATFFLISPSFYFQIHLKRAWVLLGSKLMIRGRETPGGISVALNLSVELIL